VALNATSIVAKATACTAKRYKSDRITRTKLSWTLNHWDESLETDPYDTRYRHCRESFRGLFIWQSRFNELAAC
jgi:hypothetical protein